jgi:hypothetical protein
VPTTIDTTTQVSAPGFSGQRKIAATSTGRLWAAINDLANTRWEFHYSDNGGSSWTENTSARITYSTASTGSLCIQDDHAVFAYNSNGLQLRRMPSIGATTSWGAASTLSLVGFNPDVVVHRSGTGWTAHVVYKTVSPGDLRWMPVAISAAGAFTFGPGSEVQISADTNDSPSIDFAHTGDGVTSATPHLFFVWQGSAVTVLSYRKAVYSGGSWSLSTERALATLLGSANLVSSIFDGSRTIAAAVDSANPTSIVVRGRDAADTTTTTYTPPALSDGNVTGLSITTDSAGDIYLCATGTTSDDPKYVVYDRSAGTWGSWTSIEATTVDLQSITARRAAGYYLDVLYATGASSPYTLRHERVSLNSPPNGAPWVTASGTYDINSVLPLDWDFSDPNPADTQQSYVLKRDIGGVLAYWRASDSTWQVSEQTNVTATSIVNAAAGWGADGDVAHLYYVKTTDAGGSTGPYGPALYVMPSVKVEPTLDEPDPGDVVASSMLTPVWTTAEQIAYRARVYDDSGNTIWDSDIVADTATRSLTTPAVLENGGAYEAGIQTYNLEGLASTEDRNAFTVAFTAPPDAIVTTDDSSNVYIDVAIENPSPIGDQPDVTSLDLWVRVKLGERADGERQPITPIRIATGLAPNSTYRDWAVASDVEYEYQVVSHASNGTTSTSAWSGSEVTELVLEEV